MYWISTTYGLLDKQTIVSRLESLCSAFNQLPVAMPHSNTVDRDVTTESTPLGWDRVKVSENLGATLVAPVAPVVTSLVDIAMLCCDWLKD